MQNYKKFWNSNLTKEVYSKNKTIQWKINFTNTHHRFEKSLYFCFAKIFVTRKSLKGRKLMIILFNKPYGVLSQFTPEAGHRALDEFGFPPGVYAAGRLDHDSEGALLLTDDGRLIKRLLDPKNAHPRTYLAQVDGEITDEALRKLSKGVVIKGYHTRPCKAERVLPPKNLWERVPPIRYRANIPTSWIRLTLTEGKNRQVRHMTAAVGFPTLRLIRVQIGDLSLGPLQPGEWKIIK